MPSRKQNTNFIPGIIQGGKPFDVSNAYFEQWLSMIIVTNHCHKIFALLWLWASVH